MSAPVPRNFNPDEADNLEDVGIIRARPPSQPAFVVADKLPD